MELNMLEELFADFTNTDVYYEDTDRRKCEAERDVIDKRIKEIIGDIPKKTFNEIMNNVTYAECITERSGFILGFKYAMRLMAECGVRSV